MEVVEPYRITGRLGGGRNARVFAAEHLGEAVAIKLFTPAKRRRQRIMRRGRSDPLPQWQAAFEREADLLTNIQHPAIVKVLDRGQTDDGSPYFVMPLYPETLAVRLWGSNFPQPVVQPLDCETAGKILIDILDGAGELHRNGIVHRDLKPQNILIGEDTVICDFGHAVRAADIGDQDIKRPGTFPYAAPEQKDGSAQPDGAADIYAIGLIAHLMFAGRLPRDSENIRDNVRPIDLAGWINAALNPDPAQRPRGGPFNF
ncbi:MAG: serine/threonine protein kinase [Alphaproteobacteria bacterium]|nr:serine/threonine protein kinase [Alphaproteobacteria bacterium]